MVLAENLSAYSGIESLDYWRLYSINSAFASSYEVNHEQISADAILPAS